MEFYGNFLSKFSILTNVTSLEFYKLNQNKEHRNQKESIEFGHRCNTHYLHTHTFIQTL